MPHGPQMVTVAMDKSSSSTAKDATVGRSQSFRNQRRQAEPSEASDNASSSVSIIKTEVQRTSKNSSASNSAAPSPLGSREPSPIRNPRRTTSSSKLNDSRSRKGSQQEPSPSRQMRSSVSNLASTTRSLSSAAIPSLLPSNSDPQSQLKTPQKQAVSDPKDSPRWPVSPRLRSPPPQLNRPGATPTLRNEADAPAISIQKPSPIPEPADSEAQNSGSDTEDSQAHSGSRTPARGALETVQEVSLPSSPSPVSDAALLAQVKEKLNQAEPQPDTNRDGRTLRAHPSMPESGSDSSTAKHEKRRSGSIPPPPFVTRQSSAMSAKQMKAKHEGSTQAMTVETETVSSIPQVALATGNKTESIHGTLKTKASTETIKPKKERKKATRKQPSINSGNASSKADIFEAKIANAVDEQNTSDSEETFVYDSNPPDTGERSARRFHSRTPSATSMGSQADRQNLRSIYGVIEGPGQPGPKKNMKFVNTFTSNGGDSLSAADDDGRGTGRSAGGSGRGTTRHHHIGRWGRHPGNGHPSLFDKESPFPSARPKWNGVNSRNSSGPTSPRSHQHNLSHKRSQLQMTSYDMDETTGADDETTPLVGSTRSARTGHSRRGPHNLRQAESQTFNRRPSYLNRFAACLVLTMMFLLVITGAIGFMFATSQPMSGIEIVSVTNVVTSEQVLMFDLTMKAHNPNIVVVTIDQSNLEIFAKSEHAGSDSDWWKMPHGPDDMYELDDPVNDPPLDDPSDGDDSKPNVLLGRITMFDSPLTFEGSLFHKGFSTSSGEMQLSYPGNDTSGGSERWERIYQDEFDLIIKGVVKYSLPLSARIRTATVSGRTTVKPNSANDPSLEPNTTLSSLP